MSDNELEKELKTYRPVQDPIKAEEYLLDMCRGIKHSMSIPPHVDDWDMVFSRVIKRAKLLDNATTTVSENEAIEAEDWFLNHVLRDYYDLDQPSEKEIKHIKVICQALQVNNRKIDLDNFKKQMTFVAGTSLTSGYRPQELPAIPNPQIEAWNDCVDKIKGEAKGKVIS